MDADSDEDEQNISVEVSVIDLLNFGGPNMMRNGDAVYKSSHLLELGIISQGIISQTCKIEGHCLQSSHPDHTPHTITINTAETFDKWMFHCTCKAGNGGRCKHIYAALLHIHLEKKLKFLTCTQQPKYWGKVAKEVAESIMEPALIRDLDEMKPLNYKHYEVTDEEMDFFLETLCSDPKSALAIFLSRENTVELPITNVLSPFTDVRREDVNQLREFLKDLFKSSDFGLKKFIFEDACKTHVNFYNKRICLSFVEAIDLSIYSSSQNNHLWLSERKMRITASECYKLYTAANNPNVEWHRKIENYFKPKPNLKNLKVGRFEEANAIELYEIKKRIKVTKVGLIVHPSCPWLGCSPDGIVLETKTVVEVKTLMNEANDNFESALKSVKYLRQHNGYYVLRQKHSHYAQIQINMHLLRFSKADIVINNYKSKEIVIIPVDYDETFVTDLISTLTSVYFKHVISYIYEKFTTATDKKQYEMSC